MADQLVVGLTDRALGEVSPLRWNADQQRHLQSIIIAVALAPGVHAAMVGHEEYEGVVGEPVVLELLQQVRYGHVLAVHDVDVARKNLPNLRLVGEEWR